MRLRWFVMVGMLMAVLLTLQGSVSYAANGVDIRTNISIAKGMTVSQGKGNILGAEGGGVITGTVASDGGVAIGEAWVTACQGADQAPVGWAQSGWDGTYIIAGLPSGQYYLSAAARGFVTEFYDDAVDASQATLLVVEGEVTVSVDFVLKGDGQQHGEGSISGHVIDEVTGKPIEGASVLAVTGPGSDPATGDSLFWMGEAVTGRGGMYRIEGLVTGDYLVSVSAYDYLPEFYDNVFDPANATLVHVEDRQNTPRIDFGLSPFTPGEGTISGMVLAAADSTPVLDAWVMAYDPDNPFSSVMAAQIMPDGTYRLEGLTTGNYYVVVRASQFQEEWYDNARTEEEATRVTVNSPDETSGIDFYLDYLGSISGRVTSESDGIPIPGAMICAFSTQDSFYTDPDDVFPCPDPGCRNWSYCAATDSNGDYVITGVSSGEYKVYVWAFGFMNEWFDNVTEWEEATPVTVVETETTPNIDFVLGLGGSISGSALTEDGDPVAGANICVVPVADSIWYPLEPGWNRLGCVLTDEAGHYVVTGLKTGEYLVNAWVDGFLPQWYDGVQSPESATPVAVVESEETSGIDFTLSKGGSISGQVVGEPDMLPLPGVRVCIFSAAESLWFGPDGTWPFGGEIDFPSYWGQCIETDEEGRYHADRLPGGEYYVLAHHGRFMSEWYDNAETWKEATLVTVTDPDDTPGIDFSLSLGGRISGRVVAQGSGDPIRDASICVFQVDSLSSTGPVEPIGFTQCASTNGHGVYTIAGLKTGTYVVVAYAWGYFDQWYDRVGSAAEATHIEVVSPEETLGIDFAMKSQRGTGSIAGHVTDEFTGQPVVEAYIEARQVDGWWTGTAISHEDGAYVISDLPSGRYFVSVKARGYLHEFYDNVRNPQDATPVPVDDGTVAVGINFYLEEKDPLQYDGGIAGWVSSDTLALQGAVVVALQMDADNSGDDVSGVAITDENGLYTITGLVNGPYLVMCFAIGYIGELYDNVLDPNEATMVNVVSPDLTENVNFDLSPLVWEGGGSITGTIYEGEGRQPTAGAWVYAMNTEEEPVAWDQTGPDGRYMLNGLGPGMYTVQATKASLGARWAGSVNTSGTSSPVMLGAEDLMTVTEIDLVLGLSTETGIDDEDGTGAVPEEMALKQNYPNPFNPTTTIQFTVGSGQLAGHITLKIYNVMGQEVRTLVDESKEAGDYTITWDSLDQYGQQVATGVYFCRLEAGDHTSTIRMVFMK